MDDTILACRDSSELWVAQTNPEKKNTLRGSTGHMRYDGDMLSFCVMFVNLPRVLTQDAVMPLVHLITATKDSILSSVKTFANALRTTLEKRKLLIRAEGQSDSWQGQMLIATSNRYFRVNNWFEVEEIECEHAAIGAQAHVCELVMESENYINKVSALWMIVYSITKGWRAITETPRHCSFARYKL